MDVTEYALLAAGLYFWRRGWWIGCWIAGAAALLTRELGLILIAALIGMSLLQRSWSRAAIFAVAILPGFLWDLHVDHAIATLPSDPAIPPWIFNTPLIGPFLAIFHPQNYSSAGWIKTTTQWLDGISIAGIIMCACVAASKVRRRPFTLESLICVLYAGLFVMVSTRGFWADPFTYARAFSPLAGLIAFQGATESRLWPFLPWLCLLLRVEWQLGPEALGIVRGFLG